LPVLLEHEKSLPTPFQPFEQRTERADDDYR